MRTLTLLAALVAAPLAHSQDYEKIVADLKAKGGKRIGNLDLPLQVGAYGHVDNPRVVQVIDKYRFVGVVSIVVDSRTGRFERKSLIFEIADTSKLADGEEYKVESPFAIVGTTKIKESTFFVLRPIDEAEIDKRWKK